MSNSRARSIKTRIETKYLKSCRNILKNSRARSIKTRIETTSGKCCAAYRFIREQDPLKQGLKPTECACPVVIYDVKGIREQDPLKQGLKQ